MKIYSKEKKIQVLFFSKGNSVINTLLFHKKITIHIKTFIRVEIKKKEKKSLRFKRQSGYMILFFSQKKT